MGGEELYQNGLKEYRTQNYEKAGELFQESLEIDEQNPKVWNALGIVCSKLDQFEDAATCFENAVELDPANATFKKNYSVNEKKRNSLDKPLNNNESVIQYINQMAIEGYSSNISGKSDSVELYNKGVKFLSNGEYEDSSKIFRRLLRNDGKNPILWNTLGVTLFSFTRYPEAAKCFGNAITYAPNNALYKKNNSINQNEIQVESEKFTKSGFLGKTLLSISKSLKTDEDLVNPHSKSKMLEDAFLIKSSRIPTWVFELLILLIGSIFGGSAISSTPMSLGGIVVAGMCFMAITRVHIDERSLLNKQIYRYIAMFAGMMIFALIISSTGVNSVYSDMGQFGTDMKEYSKKTVPIEKEAINLTRDEDIVRLDELIQKKNEISNEYLLKFKNDYVPDKYANLKEAVLRGIEKDMAGGTFIHMARLAYDKGDMDGYSSYMVQAKNSYDESIQLIVDEYKKLGISEGELIERVNQVYQ
jgi:tetratricopeptide (TPR) repeat protein